MSAIDDAFNAHDRTIDAKVEIEFISGNTLTVTPSGHLISMHILEEAGVENVGPFYNVSSNELTLTMLNLDNKFTTGTAFNLMRKGTNKAATFTPYIKANNSAWVPLGVFYLTEFSSDLTSNTVTVVANDLLYQLPNPEFRVSKYTTDYDFYFLAIAMEHFGIPYEKLYTPVYTDRIYDLSGITTLYSPIGKNGAEQLSALCTALSILCYCNRAGKVRFRKWLYDTSSKSEQENYKRLTDADQIIDVDTSYTVNTSTRPAAEVTWYDTYAGPIEPLYNADDIVLSSSSGAIIVPIEVPYVSLSYASVAGDDNVRLARMYPSSYKKVVLSLYNNISSYTGTPVDVAVYGTALKSDPKVIWKTAGTRMRDEAPLQLSDCYLLQDATTAESLRNYLYNYAKADLPVISVTTRGNPSIGIGDVVRVQDYARNIDFDGFVVRQEFEYTGALSCVITLLDARIMLPDLSTAIVGHISMSPRDVTCELGETPTFKVFTRGTVTSYQWYISTNSGSTYTALSGANSSTYTYGAVGPRNNGYKFKCLVKFSDNTSGEYSNPATLTVLSN